MKLKSLVFILLSLTIIGCSSGSDNPAPATPPPVQKPDLSNCSPDINVTLVWESETRNNRGYSIAFGRTEALSQRVDILEDTNSYDFSSKHPIQRGETLYAAIGAIRSNGSISFGPTHEYVFPSCKELDSILDEDPTYPYTNIYELEISEYYGDDDYPRQVLPGDKIVGEISMKPVGEVVNITEVNEELTAHEENLKDYLSSPYDDNARTISPEPGILLKQKFDNASRANLTDIPFPEEMPDQLCVEFMDRQPTKAQYSTLYKYQHIVPEVPGEFAGQVVTKVLAGAEIGISDFNKYANELTDKSLYVGESTDIEYRGQVTSYFIRKADGYVFYKKVKEYKDEEFDEDTEEETVIRNTTYYGYCYNKNASTDSSKVLKLNAKSPEEDKDSKKGEEKESEAEPELPEFSGDMQEFEAELVVKLQNLMLESGEDTVFNSFGANFVASNERAELDDFSFIGKEDYYCREVQNYDRNSSLARGDVYLYNKKVLEGYGPLIPIVDVNKVVTSEDRMLRQFDQYRMYNTQKSLVSYFVTERVRENTKVSFIRRGPQGQRWYYLRYEQKRFVTLNERLEKNEVFYVGVCIPK